MREKLVIWTISHAVLMLMVTIAALIANMLFVIVWAVLVSFAVLIVLSHKMWIRLEPAGGYANYVTFARLVLLLFAVSMHQVLSTAVFVILIIVVMIADGIDGYLARRLGQSTDFGEVFDMEVDAFLALSVAFLIWQQHTGAYWVLVAGALRYIFVIVYYVARWHHRRRPAMPEARLMAVAFFISLLTAFAMQWEFAKWLVGAGCLLVTASFLREFYLLSKMGKV